MHIQKVSPNSQLFTRTRTLTAPTHPYPGTQFAPVLLALRLLLYPHALCQRWESCVSICSECHTIGPNPSNRNHNPTPYTTAPHIAPASDHATITVFCIQLTLTL